MKSLAALTAALIAFPPWPTTAMACSAATGTPPMCWVLWRRAAWSRLLVWFSGRGK